MFLAWKIVTQNINYFHQIKFQHLIHESRLRDDITQGYYTFRTSKKLELYAMIFFFWFWRHGCVYDQCVLFKSKNSRKEFKNINRERVNPSQPDKIHQEYVTVNITRIGEIRIICDGINMRWYFFWFWTARFCVRSMW